MPVSDIVSAIFGVLDAETTKSSTTSTIYEPYCPEMGGGADSWSYCNSTLFVLSGSQGPQGNSDVLPATKTRTIHVKYAHNNHTKTKSTIPALYRYARQPYPHI